MNIKNKGFTVIELLVVIFLLISAGVIFYLQKNAVTVAARDEQRKTSINSMYYALEKVYYPANKHYPRTLDEKTLAIVDPAIFTDPDGKKLGDQASSYRYEPTNCNGDSCLGYSLRSMLENEADYIKTNAN